MSNGNRDGRPERDGDAGPRRTRHTLAFAAVGAFLLFVVVLLPFTLTSVVTDIASPPSQHVYELTPDGAASPSATYMHLNVVGVDEWQGTVTLRVSGQHTCAAPCSWDDVVLFVSVPPGRVAGRGLPPAEQVRFPALRSQPVNVTIALPVDGEPVRYPFDRYQFTLGVLLRFENPDGSDVPVQVASAQSDGQRLFASLRMAAPRMTMSTPQEIDRTEIDPAVPSLPYDLTVSMTFSRPLYLQVLTVLLVLLITAAAAYAVFLRPLNELVINAGGLVLGVWGIRAILLGSSVPGITAVDLALSMVILFLLLAVTVRMGFYLYTRSHVPTTVQRRYEKLAAAAPPPLSRNGRRLLSRRRPRPASPRASRRGEQDDGKT